MSEKLNLSCSSTRTKDESKIVIRNDNVTILKNDKEEGKMSLKDLFWLANNIISYQITLPINSTATVNTSCMISTSSNIKVLFITTDNSVVAEKKYENNKLFFKYDDNCEIPLGKLTVLTGTDLNRLDGDVVFYNGTPNANISNITDGVYSTTIDIIAGF